MPDIDENLEKFDETTIAKKKDRTSATFSGQKKNLLFTKLPTAFPNSLNLTLFLS